MATGSQTVKYITEWPSWSNEWYTQQENSYTKHAFRKRLPVTAMLGRVNEASQWNVCGQNAGQMKCNPLPNVSWEGSESVA